MKQRLVHRIGIVQRVLPAYRVNLFDLLAESTNANVSVFAGEGRSKEMIARAIPQQAHFYQARNHHLFNGSFYLCWQGGLLRWLREWEPDVVIMEANPRYLHSFAAMRWMHARGKKIIGWGLGAPDKSNDLFGLRSWMRKRFVKQFDAVITYSTQGAREYHQLDVDPTRIFIAPNAAARQPDQPMPERPDTYRGGSPVIVFVGRLQARKRVDILIQACAMVASERQPLLWVIGDGPHRDALEQIAETVYPLTTFFGALHGKELGQRLVMADLFVLPGTGGLAVQEAMSYGLPVIVGEADGTQSDLVREENGWLLPDASPEKLAALIRQAITDIDSLREKGRAGYRIVKEEINLEKMVSVFEQAINEVLHG